MKRFAFLLVIGVMSLVVIAGAHAQGDIMIEDGKEVAFTYTLTVDGEVVDQSPEGKPVTYVQGDKTLIPGLMTQLAGLKAGDEKTVTVTPENAYGQVNPEAYREVPRDSLAEGLTPEVNMPLQVSNPEGKTAFVRIAEVKDETLVIDFNHPLAGKTLVFDVKIVDVK